MESLSAPHVLSYTYTRSTGPIIGAFLEGLAERRFVGIRAADGTTLVPPAEYDPHTSETLTELVPVADVGTVTAWCHGPRGVTWALIQLDGADTALLAPLCGRARTGLRVRAQWPAEPQHRIPTFEAASEVAS